MLGIRVKQVERLWVIFYSAMNLLPDAFPITFVKSLEDLPPFENYNMEGRTYKYMKKVPLYPFGYGLSYTTFEYTG